MLKNRLIAVILVRDGHVVQSVKFKHTNAIHYDPIHAIESFNRWAVDEIVLLNVSKTADSKEPFLKTVYNISKECFVPLSAGGWIESLEDASALIQNGADKTIINTQAYNNPDLVTRIAQKFGNQCAVVSIDVINVEGNEKVAINRGSDIQDALTPLEWAKKAEQYGAGELVINSIDHDGYRKGYNIPLIKSIVDAVKIPVVAMGGVFKWDHLEEGITKAGASAVAAANIFHYTEHSTRKAKRHLLKNGLNFRKLEKI